MKISICMATYNGAKYINSAIGSILEQCDQNVELIIVDDASTDGTQMILQGINDHRLQVVLNESNLGVVRNFNKALSLATGDIIFLSDQDDLWMNNRIATILNVFGNDSNVCCVRHSVKFIDEKGCLLDVPPEIPRQTFISNALRNSFRGCTMAINRNLLSLALPLPSKIPMHDHWLGLCSYFVGKEVYLSMPLLYYRRHEYNVSRAKTKLSWPVIAARWYLLSGLLFRLVKRNIFHDRNTYD